MIKTAALLLAGVLTACANSPSAEASLSWEQGWRKGTVTAVGDGPLQSHMLASACQSLALLRPPGQRWVTVQYRSNSRPVWRTVAVPKASTLQVNDPVVHNPSDCGAPVVVRAS